MSRDNETMVVDALRGCRRVLVVTGAGMSAESGLPTYRGIGGLYEGDGTGVVFEDNVIDRCGGKVTFN